MQSMFTHCLPILNFYHHQIVVIWSAALNDWISSTHECCCQPVRMCQCDFGLFHQEIYCGNMYFWLLDVFYYVCKGMGWNLSGPCTATSKTYCALLSCLSFNQSYTVTSKIFCCFPFLLIPQSIPPFWWSIGLSLWGCHNCCLVPWSYDPCDKILGKVLPHNHISCPWLIILFLDTCHMWGCSLNPVWEDVHLGDSVVWAFHCPL
jgi:hypothetical protein